MNRIACCLPHNLKSICEMGCIYREKAFKHIACPIALKTKELCVAPCNPKDEFCKCKTEMIVLSKKEKNEVFLL